MEPSQASSRLEYLPIINARRCAIPLIAIVFDFGLPVYCLRFTVGVNNLISLSLSQSRGHEEDISSLMMQVPDPAVATVKSRIFYA